MMMSLVVEPASDVRRTALPASVDAHPDLAHQLAIVSSLKQRLQTAEQERAALLRQHDEATAARHDAAIALALNPADPGFGPAAARVRDLDVQLADHDVRTAGLREALDQQQRVAREVRARVESDLRPVVQDAVAAVITAQQELIEEFAVLQCELERLYRYRLVSIPSDFFRLATYVPRWQAEAKAFLQRTA